jgi:hypothetical protein
MKLKAMQLVAGSALMVTIIVVGTSVGTQASGATTPAIKNPEKTLAHGKRLEGTWRVQVSIRDCTDGTVLRNFPAMLTFAKGGTLTETTTGFPITQRSPGHGVWSFLSNQTYSAVSEAFLFNPAGVWIGTQRLTQAIEIGPNGDEFNSTATNEIADVNGTLMVTGCATAVGSRFE